MPKFGRSDYDALISTHPDLNIAEDEPVFILRGKDRLFEAMLRAYVDLRVQEYGLMDRVAHSANELRLYATQWQRAFPGRVAPADLPEPGDQGKLF